MIQTIIICFIILNIDISFALPRFSVINGASCIVCHVNPTGTGLRNSYGNDIVSLEQLPLERWLESGDENWDGYINDNLQIGGDFRIQGIQYNKSDSSRTTAIFPMQAEIYTYLTLNANAGIYAKIGIPRKNADANKEYWILINNLPYDSWIKLGRSIPNYGMRIDDHTSFTRGGNINKTLLGLNANIEGLMFTPSIYLSPPTIVEMGLPIYKNLIWTGSIATSLIKKHNDEETSNITSQLVYYSSFNNSLRYMAGISYMNEKKVNMFGIAAGINYKKITWTLEFDHAKNWINNYTSIALYNEIAWEVIQGIHIIGKHDFFDPETELKNGAINRYTVGLEIYPLNILELKIQARFNNINLTKTEQKEPEYLLQTHLYF